MLSEISQAVKDIYNMISPISGTYSTKQISNQNITRDIEIKNNVTITRGEWEGIVGKGVYRSYYKKYTIDWLV